MCSSITKIKRVTDPLDDKVKARIIGWDLVFDPRYASSGSEHSAYDDDVTSSNLSELFYGCTIDESNDISPKNDETDSDEDSSVSNMNNEANNNAADQEVNTILSIDQDTRDEFQNMLKVHVSKAIKLYSFAKSSKQKMRRNVMGFLRNFGYNAGICKTKWETCGGLTAGNYEFIDVVLKREYSGSVRYFIDLDFASEFEIARPTSGYERLISQVPDIFVGKMEDLKKVLRIVCEGAKRSLKSSDMLLPPWKKHRFMQNKWLGSYKRTTNAHPMTSFCASKQVYGGGGSAVKCRAVGFDVGGQLFPARTR